MVRIIFIVLSTISSGELTIACEFASRLSQRDYDTTFIVEKSFCKFVQNRGFGFLGLDITDGHQKNKELIFDFIDRFNADFFVISDVYTMECSYPWSGIKFEIIREFNIPIIGVDEYEFPSTGYNVDYYGLITVKLPNILEKCDYIIRDCPINVVRSENDRVKCFSLYEKKLSLSEAARDQVRKKLNLEKDEKLIFYTTSSWELLNMHNLFSLSNLIKWIPLILQNYLSSLGRKVSVIHVGANPWQNIEDKNIKYYNFHHLLPDEFDSFLLSSDLFITLNIVSVSLTKAIYAQIPSIVFQNNKIIDFAQLKLKLDKMPGWYSQMANEVKIVHPFRASTFGWYKFLDAVLDKNEYTNTFATAPFFKMPEVMECLGKYLYDEAAIDRLKRRQAEYVDKLLTLLTPDEIMDDILSKVQITDEKTS